ncbi:MAG: type IV pilus twitching motility protein PilT [Formosimonas sp.]
MAFVQMLMDLTTILHAAQQQNASDVHIDASHTDIFIRTAGQIKRLDGISISSAELSQCLAHYLTAEQCLSLESKQQFDFALYESNLALNARVTVYFNRSGLTLALRLMPSVIPSLAELGAPEFLQQLSPFEPGLVLITGPTGGGKSTTLASYLSAINQKYAAHVVTLEDPVEYRYASNACLFHQFEENLDFVDYPQALKSALRMDPDVIVIGELRDLDSIKMALRAAETGHLVLATLHSADAAATITRLIDVFDEGNKAFIRHVLSSVLQGVVAQRLVMSGTGNQRVAVFETLVANRAVKNMIREQKESQLSNLMQTHAQVGMFTFAQHYQKLLNSGKVVDSVPQWAS